MKERPIIFSGEMVQAILDGRKTQTRRVINPGKFLQCLDPEDDRAQLLEYCPYGQPGDRLWVRETWVKWDGGLTYLADCINKRGEEDEDIKRCRLDYGVKWRPSIFMPRWASRITLEVTGVRVERVQSISQYDAVAEGMVDIARSERRTRQPGESPFEQFRVLWDSINAKRGYSWESNPWVWAISFLVNK